MSERTLPQRVRAMLRSLRARWRRRRPTRPEEWEETASRLLGLLT